MALRFFGMRRRLTFRRCLALGTIILTFFVNAWLGMHGFQGLKFRGMGEESSEPRGRADRERMVIRHGGEGLTPGSCPHWCYGTTRSRDREASANSSLSTETKPYFLTAVISVRIYEWKDPARLSTRELIQWLRYVSYAGVEHVYLYDAYAFSNESQRDGLSEFIASGYVTYTDWHHLAVPFSLGRTQAAAYRDSLKRWGHRSSWQLGVDMDEYPFHTSDQQPGFLARYLRYFDTTWPSASQVSELSMQNFLYLGKPLNVRKHPLLIDRIWRRTKVPSNDLVKPVYRPAAIRWPDIHRNSLKYGDRQVVPVDQLRLNHYWGARLQNWGDDTQEVLDMTVEDRSMEPVIEYLYKCDWCRPP